MNVGESVYARGLSNPNGSRNSSRLPARFLAAQMLPDRVAYCGVVRHLSHELTRLSVGLAVAHGDILLDVRNAVGRGASAKVTLPRNHSLLRCVSTNIQ